MIRLENHVGQIHINDNFLVQLVAHTVMNCFGVAGISDKPSAFQKVANRIQRKKSAGDIKVKYQKDQIYVQLHIFASYGVNLTEIVNSIVNKVRFTLEEITGCTVANVSVYIDAMKA